MSLESIFAAIGVIITGVGGIYIAVHEIRRKERKTTRREIDDLITEIDHVYQLLLEQRRYIYKLYNLMLEAGLNPPPPPDPGFDEHEYEVDEGKAEFPDKEIIKDANKEE